MLSHIMGLSTLIPKIVCPETKLLYIYINTPKKVSSPPPSNRDYNFQIICYIVNFITLLCGEFNNAHLDTSFASIDPKILKLRLIEETYPEI